MVAVRALCVGGRIENTSVAVGSCSEVAQRLPLVESLLTGEQISADLPLLIDHQHLPELSPIDDIRATAKYRRESALQLVRRTVSECTGAAV